MKTKSSAIFVAFAFGLMAALPKTHAVVPTPDGCYPNFTTAEGCDALSLLTTGAANTGLGWRSLFSDSTGSFNTGVGAGTLVLNNGEANTAVGAAALLLNTTGDSNTANGTFALFNNTEGRRNNAFGSYALGNHETGDHNNAFGSEALSSDISGAGNNAFGDDALRDNTGNSNTAIGDRAGLDLTTGSFNVCIGAGAHGVAGVSNTTWISNVYSSVATARQVYVDSDNKIGTLSSSRRYKDEIKPMDNASEALFALKPVTFRYKKHIDPMQALSFGLIAEEVAKINPELITRGKDDKPETVRYEAVNAMLLNEFLKEHRKIEEQQAAIVELKSVVAQQQKEFRAAMVKQQKEMENVIARLKQQEAKIQRVNDTIELTEAAPRVMANND